MTICHIHVSLIAVQGPDEAAKKRVHPAAIAHANRVARAQQVGVTLYGYKVFPDLTPGRAFMWGSILALWAVGTVSLASARALDIHSVRSHPSLQRKVM